MYLLLNCDVILVMLISGEWTQVGQMRVSHIHLMLIL